jgi:hypothetical protein
MTMFTKHVTKQMSAFCNGELSSAESDRMREHLSGCARCREEYDEIKLGVNLAQQLPLVTAPAEMWTELEALLDQRSRKPLLEPKVPRFGIGFSFYRVAAVSAVLVVAAVIGYVWVSYYGPRASWEVANLIGKVQVDGDEVISEGNLEVGETIETGSSSKAKINVAKIGELVLEPNTRVTLVRTRPTEHRISLEQGRMHAKIWAPPRLFFVNTPSAEAIDLGCEYSLEVDKEGRGLLHVTLGAVALVRNGREVYVPRYAKCESWPGIGPGTPFFEDASETFVRLLERFDFENGGDEPLNALLGEARQRDTFTLWHLLSRTEGEQRVRVLDRMIELVGLPAGITREGTLTLDPDMLEAWKDEMDTVWF